jgi:ribonuclease D
MVLITKEKELAEICRQIGEDRRCAIDLEFVPERTYEPVLCLIQIATTAGAALVDPLAGLDLSPLWQALNQEGILVVLHAGSQDLELIYALSGNIPINVFDTQIAAGFAGFGYPIGYGKLLNQLLGVTIAKTESFTDWTTRPLTDSQVEYAIEDVLHLLPMYDELCEQLRRIGRLEWAVEECKRLSNADRYVRDKTQDFLRIKGASALNRRGLAVLQTLCSWRNSEARRVNRPAKSIVADNTLLELARRPPREVSEIQRIRGVRIDQIRAYGSPMLTAIEKGKAVPDADCPIWPSSRIPPKREVLLADMLFACLKVMTYEIDLATELVATRDELQTLIKVVREGKSESNGLPLLQGWRKEIAGGKLLQMLDGAPLMVTCSTQSDPPIIMEIGADCP